MLNLIHEPSLAVPLLSQARWRSLTLMLLRFSKSLKSWFHTSKSLASQTQSKHRNGILKGNSKCPRASNMHPIDPYSTCTKWHQMTPNDINDVWVRMSSCLDGLVSTHHLLSGWKHRLLAETTWHLRSATKINNMTMDWQWIDRFQSISQIWLSNNADQSAVS